MLIVTFIYTVGVYLIFVTINAICESCMLYTYSSGMTGWLLALLLVTLAFAVIFLAGYGSGRSRGLVIYRHFIHYFRVLQNRVVCKAPQTQP